MDDERYYRRKPKKILDATTGWDWQLKGIYSILIDIIMLRDDDLPDDAGYIAGHIGCTKNRWTGAKKKLIELGKIEIVDEKIVQKTAKLEQNFRKSKSKQASVSRSRPNKNKDLTVSNETHRDRDKDIKEKDIGKPISKKPPPKKPPKRKTAMPENWLPEPLSQTLKDKLNLTQQEYNHEFAKFTDSAKQHGRKYIDWQAAWRNWLKSDYGTWGRRQSGADRSAGNQRNKSAAERLSDAFDEIGERVF